MAKERNNSATDSEEFVFTRVLDAPRELVFKMLTESEHMVRWWGPKGFEIHIAKLHLRPGGVFHFHMQSPDGSGDKWAKFVYREIVVPERLVYVTSFSDEQGNMQRHPLDPGWPLEMLTTLTLSEYDGKTKLTIRTVPINATKEERKTFEEGHKSMQQGFGGTFDKFDEYLATLGRDTSAKNSPTEDREIIITRVINAPRELVFKAWTDPRQVGQWWGPRGFTTTTHEMDVRHGGVWRFVMHGPDGVDYPNKIVYSEVVNPKRLVFMHGSDTEDAREPFYVTVTFDEQDGKTKLAMRSLFGSAAERDKVVREYNAIEGGNQTLGRLEEHLAKA